MAFGFIMFINNIREAAGIPALTQEEKDKLELGTYRISTKDGIQYVGLFDSEMKDGFYIRKRSDKFFSEEWRSGQRVRYKEITKEEFNKLKDGNSN